MVISSGCGVLWFLQMRLQIYFPYLYRAPLDLDSSPLFDAFGLAIDCPEPFTPSQPLDFAQYFKVFYEKDFHLHIIRSPFEECITSSSWLLTRFETIQDQLASSRANEYAGVWFSILATRHFHVGLKNRSKLMPSTEVYSPYYVARQFGLV